MAIDLAKIAEDSDENWEKIIALRKCNLQEEIRNLDLCLRSDYVRDGWIERAIDVLSGIFRALDKAGVHLKLMEPGHGPGHIARDHMNALSLLTRIEGNPAEIFVGIIAGTLHDIGCALVDRYSEKHRAIRHAEVGALLLQEIFNEGNVSLNHGEGQLVCYVVAAHTHYLKPTDVTGADGIVHRIEPYLDTYPDGKPIYAVWYPRWVDRLDCVGPGFIARHYLTLAKPHQDFTSKGFVDVDFEKQMQPVFDEKANGVHTMLGHLRMFAQSQVDSSPYGKHDYGLMKELRERAKGWTEEVYLSVEERRINEEFVREISQVWHEFLAEKIEPYGKGAAVADHLQIMFERLPLDTQAAWALGFVKVMEHYFRWKISVWMPEFNLRLPGFRKTIREML